MLNYIKSELYRNFHRKYFWVYTGIFSLLGLLMNLMGAGHNGKTPLSDALSMCVYIFVFIIFILLPIIDMVTAEEHKNGTMKNTISSGISRSTVVISKFIVTVILCFVFGIIGLGVFSLSSFLLFGAGNEALLCSSATRILISLPLFIGTVSIGTFIALAINNNTLFSFAYFGVFTITSYIIKALSKLVSRNFEKIYNILITVQLGSLKGNQLTADITSRAIISGIAYTLVFLVLSIVVFNKKEIK